MPAFYNRATLTLGSRVIDSNTVRGELSAALSVAKTAVHALYRPGDAIAFAVTLTNSGATDATSLELRDDLGAYEFGGESRIPLEYVEGTLKYFVNGAPQEAPPMDANQGLLLRDIRVPANGDATILYAARVNEFAPLGPDASVTNTVRLDDASSAALAAPAPARALPAEGGSSALPAFARVRIFADPAARLTIRKSLNPASVAPGEPLTYTLRIENSGATAVAAGDGAMVSDRFEPLLNIDAVRYNGATWSAPANYGYDPGAGLFTTAAGQIEVPAARFTQDAQTGRWQIEPGASAIEITGTLR